MALRGVELVGLLGTASATPHGVGHLPVQREVTRAVREDMDVAIGRRPMVDPRYVVVGRESAS